MEHFCGHIYVTKIDGEESTVGDKTYSWFTVTTPEGKVIDTYDFIHLGEHVRLDIENDVVRIYPDICCYLVYDDYSHKVYGINQRAFDEKSSQVYTN